MTSMQGSPPLIPRVLDVVKAQLCFVIGTVYMEMPQKPNVLDDLTRDVRVSLNSHISLKLILGRIPYI